MTPDVQGVASQWMTVEECMEMAADAVASAVEEYAKARKDIPKASSLEAARAATGAELASMGAAFPDGTLFQLVKAPSVGMTPVKISISVARSVLERIDAKASGQGMTRARHFSSRLRNSFGLMRRMR